MITPIIYKIRNIKSLMFLILFKSPTDWLYDYSSSSEPALNLTTLFAGISIAFLVAGLIP